MLLSGLLNIITKKVDEEKGEKKTKKAAPKNPIRKDSRSHLLGGWRFFLFLAVGSVVAWWWLHGNVCGLPLKYRIGQLDDRFGISEAEMLESIRAAERFWESSLGHDLFEHDSSGDNALTINLVYDNRQKATQEMKQIEKNRNDLEEDLVDIVDEYERLKEVFERREASILELNQLYNERLDTFERTVNSWNKRGGAPPDVYDSLQQERVNLGEMAQEINNSIDQQKELADLINELADAESETVQGFNESVREFNEEFATQESGEEEQGIYGSGTINVYQYDNQQDLVMLLAHEMGHALGLGHTDDPNSIMYPLKNERQTTGQVEISAQSRDELFENCNLR